MELCPVVACRGVVLPPSASVQNGVGLWVIGVAAIVLSCKT